MENTNKTTEEISIQEKTKNQTGIKGYINYLIYIIGAVLIFIAPIIHFNFSKENPEIVSYEKVLDNNIILLENDLKSLKENYSLGQITAKDYIVKNEFIDSQIVNQKKENKKLLKNKKNDTRIIGWLTLRSFLVGFGIRLPYLFFSLLISFLIFKYFSELKKQEIEINPNLKVASAFLQIACYSITFYELIWCFWYSQDYPLSTYKWAVLALSGLSATFAYYFVIYKRNLFSKLQNIIGVFSKIAVIDAPKYMNPTNKAKYEKDYLESLEKGIK